MKLLISLLFSFLFFVGVNAQTIKIGSLQYGSVNWELKLIKELELDKKNGIDLQIVELASKNAAAVALQGGAVGAGVWFGPAPSYTSYVAWGGRPLSTDKSPLELCRGTYQLLSFVL